MQVMFQSSKMRVQNYCEERKVMSAFLLYHKTIYHASQQLP